MMKKTRVIVFVILSTVFLSLGYAQVSDNLRISGIAYVEGEQYDIFITDISPESAGTMAVDNYYSTIVTSSIHGASQATFTITVKNQSDKIYVFERIVEGSATGFEGIYTGDGITYTLDGLTTLQEVAPGTTLTFRVTIKADSTVNSDNVVTYYKFIEKTGEEVLPGAPGDGDPDDPGDVETDPDNPTDPDDPIDPTPPTVDADHNFFGLLEALLSENDRCLNDPNDKDVIYNAIQKELKNAPYILHCLTNSISGGNMTNITLEANRELSTKMHFLFTPVKGDENTLYLYMYEKDSISDENEGEPVLVYFTVIRYFPDQKRWDDDGVYVGKAKVAYLDGGGNSGKKAWMIDPGTWTAGAP